MPKPHDVWARAIASSVIAVVVVACSGAGPAARPTPTAGAVTTSPPAPSPRSFVSERHGYGADVPPFWDVAEYEGRWIRLEQFRAGDEVPGEDVISSPDGESFLVVNSMPIPSGMTPAEWLSAFDARVEAGLDPACPEETRTDTFLGSPATIVEQRCQGSVIVGRSLTHGGRGYYFTSRFEADDEDAEALLDEIVRSLRFVGA